MLKNLRILMKFPKFIALNFLLGMRIKIEERRQLLKRKKELRLKEKARMKMLNQRENISPADDLPPFPGSQPDGGTIGSGEKIAAAPAAESPDVQELAKDLVTAGFEIAHAINPKIRELDEKEKTDIGKPLAKVVAKYDLGKYLSYFSYVDEAMLVYHLGKAVTTRVKEVKDANNVRSNGGPERKREDSPNS